MLLLSGGRNYSKYEVIARFEMSDRTFHRYISTFKASGLIVEQINGRYSIRKIEPKFKEISELLHFSEEEAYILNKAIHAIDDNNLLKNNLIKKLYSLYDFDRVSETILKPKQAEHIQTLYQAIKQKKQVILRSYQSAHGNIIRDRLVEVFSFTPNYQMLWAYDLESRTNKQFKVSRIGGVTSTVNYWQFENSQQASPMDPFRISGKNETNVDIILSLRAYNLMIEEYPLTEKYIEKSNDNNYCYQGPICGYEGIGRFCLGLIDEIEMLKPSGLIKYIQKKIQKSLTKFC
jgi:predicted DNA-binding transcriptional regulator YafY